MSEVMSSLLWLYNNGYLNIDQYNVLSNFYKNDTRDISVIKAELRGFYESSANVVSKVDSILDVEVIDVFDDLDNVSDQSVDNVDNYFVSSVSDFNVDNNDFIFVDFSDGNFRVFHNVLDLPGEILYNRLFDKSGNVEEASSLFLKMLSDSSEVKLYDFSSFLNTDVYDELPDVFRNCINTVKNSFPNSSIVCSPIDNIYIVDKSLVRVVNNNGIYQALPIGYSDGSDISSVNQSSNESLSSEKSIGGSSKSLGTHPAFGGIKWGSDENGFMNVLSFVFIVGICVGMVCMIFLSLFAK